MRRLGDPLPRREDADLLTGRARTVADLTAADVGAPVLELAFVRSPVAHGRLRGADVTAAREVPGVAGAWAAADLPGLPPTPVPPAGRGALAGRDWAALAADRVRFVGQPVAVVAADSRAHAEDGARRVVLDVEELPPVLGVRAALADDAPRLWDGRDDVAQVHTSDETPEDLADVFVGAPVVVEGRFRQPRLLPTSLEGRAVLARPDDGGGVTVWVSHQAPHSLRGALAEAFALDPRQVRVVVPATGGAFGAKSQGCPEYVVAVALARLTGRPVRWSEDRIEAMTAATRGRGQDQVTRMAADADGRILAYSLDVLADLGAYPHTGAQVPSFTVGMATGAYRTPRVGARATCVLTTTPPSSSYRGAGRPEAAYAVERTVDLLARRLGMDPAELRRRNLLRPDELPYETPTGRTYDSGDYGAALEKVLAEVGYDDVRAEQTRRRADGGRPLGIGLATYVERSGAAPHSPEYGAVEACPDGTVVARTGSQSTGQGHLTAFAQVVAAALDVDLDAVRVVQGDTAEVPDGFGSFGSRSMQVGGGALWLAAQRLVEEARRRFAVHRGTADDAVTYAAGVLSAPGAEPMTLAEVAAATGPLTGEESFTPPQAFPYGAYAAVVEVDPDLGVVDVQRLVAVDDHGVVVNPLLVDGQGYGSITQGLGQALTEEAVTAPDGRPAATSLLDHLLPTAADVPPVQLEETAVPNPNQPFGAKGAGEAGCIGVPPAVVNAVCDALDVDSVDMPLTPETVWRALRGR
ncbi:xanthine dehydrogenase family protein molybdopterin-binding subunit [Geodermatophilus sp. FMUSA9-8]|uniref:xanthine dehydrogenase family protein molybdopterin-binding subunit n=1 Tax=Geodermatophilus sp. FMUSA9-8 TaxID=3120155 RepID=UPI00300A10C7